MEPGIYWMTFLGKNFADNVKDKFEKVISEDLYEEDALSQALKDLDISSLVPKINKNGSFNQGCKKALNNLVICQCIPAGVKPSPSRQIAAMNQWEDYIQTLVGDYHKDQQKLFDLLGIKCNEAGYMLVGDNDRRASTEEFVQAMDGVSIDVMEMYKDVDQKKSFIENKLDLTQEIVFDTAQGQDVDQNRSFNEEVSNLTKKINLCINILVSRLYIHMDQRNDLMTEYGWKTWRNHTCVIGSFAIYYLSLQLCRKKVAGSFHTMESSYLSTEPDLSESA